MLLLFLKVTFLKVNFPSNYFSLEFFFRWVYIGRYYLLINQNWFGKRYDISWRKSQQQKKQDSCTHTVWHNTRPAERNNRFLVTFDVLKHFHFPIHAWCEYINTKKYWQTLLQNIYFSWQYGYALFFW